MRWYKLILLMLSTGTFSVSVFAFECDDDVLKNSARVSGLIMSNDSTMLLLGVSQRDCLAVELQKLKNGDDSCPTFRKFERDFLSLDYSVQIENGKECRLTLENR